MRRFKLDQHFGLIIVPLNTFLHNLTLDDQLATLACLQETPAPRRPAGARLLQSRSGHADDDRRLIVQRSVIDRDTGQTALLLLSRATDWNQQVQEITYLVDRSD